jgi:hypothetical protein
MQAAIDTASSNKIEQLYLEVIVGNTPAYDLYLALGFRDLRRLLVLESGSTEITAEKSKQPVHSATVNDALRHFNRLHHMPIPWQRQYETLAKLDADSTQSWFVTHNDLVQAYAIGRASDNGIQFYDLAFAPDHEDALSAVVSHVHQQYPDAKARMVNLGDDDPAWPVLQSLGYQEILSQHEMMLSL